jgi:hypothetical protein
METPYISFVLIELIKLFRQVSRITLILMNISCSSLQKRQSRTQSSAALAKISVVDELSEKIYRGRVLTDRELHFKKTHQRALLHLAMTTDRNAYLPR